jgi:hypothetical protein
VIPVMSAVFGMGAVRLPGSAAGVRTGPRTSGARRAPEPRLSR